MKTPMKETDADKAVTAAALENSGQQLQAHIEGIEGVNARIADLQEQLKVKYTAVKSDGYSKGAVKTVVKRRAMSEKQIAAQVDLSLQVTLYEAALDSLKIVEMFP